jgi:hypothetical protein
MSTLTDPALTFAVLREIATWLSLERVSYRQDDNACSSELAKLRTLSVQDLSKLAALQPAMAGVSVDSNALRWALSVLEDGQRFDRLRDQFICKGASNALMHRLFKIDERTTRKLRRQFRVHGRQGRPPFPSKPVRDAIQALWHGFAEPDPRERYLLLSGRFPEWSLDTLHLVVCENDPSLATPPTVRPKHGKGFDRQRISAVRRDRRLRSGRRR